MPTPEPYGFQTYYETPTRPKKPTSGPMNPMAVTSFVTGLISVPVLPIIWATQAWATLLSLSVFLIPLAAVTLGFVSLNQIRQQDGKGRGLAIAGIWLGAATFLILLAAILLLFAALSAWAG